MDMKMYQRRVIDALQRYLDILGSKPGMLDAATAYRKHWQGQGVRLGVADTGSGAKPMQPYQDVVPGVPVVCAKVPTGGGKTFIACNAIRPIFDTLLQPRKLVVWLVPSEAILAQTLAALKNPQHPYRRQLDVDFSSRVEVYSKEQLLMGQNFSAEDTAAQLSVCVLSYDSFRGRKENLKARRENSQLAPFARALFEEMGAPEMPLEDTDKTALLQILNRLSPLVVVDESHHARSALSLKMLREFNPCFVLELTATPRAESNIIAFADARLLKAEGMIKLPVIVYNRNEKRQVLADAIDLQRALETEAKSQQAAGGKYIRPIVLFQAQPRAKENSATFDKLREKLVAEFGIDATHIAIRTADINELKNVDLLAPHCPIRYIITVNALKEGWDCPFAYILASLANKSSAVEVEQILGRVLRQPHAERSAAPMLNLSYVLTCSADFREALKDIVKGLNAAGLSEHDCRAVSEEEKTPVPPMPQQPEQPPLDWDDESPADEAEEEFLQFGAEDTEVAPSDAQRMLAAAEEQGKSYEEAARQQQEAEAAQGLGGAAPYLPPNLKANMPIYRVLPEFAQELQTLHLPQFILDMPQLQGSLLDDDSGGLLLEEEMLSAGFKLSGRPTAINFDDVDAKIAAIDVREDSGVAPKAYKVSLENQRKIRSYLSSLAPEQRQQYCIGVIHAHIDRMDTLSSKDLLKYVRRVVEDIDEKHLPHMERAPLAYAQKIKEHIKSLLADYSKEQFELWRQTGKIRCEGRWRLPAAINTAEGASVFGRSLYEQEEKMNSLEQKLAMELSGMDNVRWWHRNLEGRGFRINGFINHYPDFIIMLKSGVVVLAETKGPHLKNDDSARKLQLGRAWQGAAGARWRYYMVFEDAPMAGEGAVDMAGFRSIVQEL